MSVTNIIVATGLAAGMLAVLFAVLGEMTRRRQDQRRRDRTHAALGDQASLGMIGMTDTDVSPDTVILTPKRLLRLASLFGSTLLMFFLWHPAMVMQNGGPAVAVVISSGIIYLALFIANYEARYDSKGLTAPNWLLKERHYPWTEFVQMETAGGPLYRLQFQSGRVALQKYLVGMPALLTFIAEMGDLNRRA